jgi:uncharacterized protein YndB with AHSA1/START domain
MAGRDTAIFGQRARYAPGPAHQASIRQDGEKWTLILVRELRHAPPVVWSALTDPAQLREWAPYEADGKLDKVGARVKLTWVSTSRVTETAVTCAEAPRVLEYNDIRWELEPTDTGTRLTLWHNIDGRFIAWGAAGWHISFDVLERLLGGDPIGRIAGPDAAKVGEWPRLVSEYAEQFAGQRPDGKPQQQRNLESDEGGT